MWLLVSSDGEEFSELAMSWPDVPRRLFKSLTYRRDGGGCSVSLVGCHGYGFQRYSLSNVSGVIATGCQLIGVRGELAFIIDINETTGDVRSEVIKASDVTYDQTLIR
jgi:hypothetical protein